MDENQFGALFELGVEKRRATLGDEYVERSLSGADDFSLPFQKALTGVCWGFCWADPTLDAKTRSLMNLTMLAALGRTSEWELHCRGALRNGVSKEELRAAIHIIAAYCGFPAALSCMHSARKILKEAEEKKGG